MNSYLVRIYRRGEDNPRVLVGVVEEPGVNGKKAFTNLYELWEILNPVQNLETQAKKKKGMKSKSLVNQSEAGHDASLIKKFSNPLRKSY
jgi:hypothetical protein